MHLFVSSNALRFSSPSLVLGDNPIVVPTLVEHVTVRITLILILPYRIQIPAPVKGIAGLVAVGTTQIATITLDLRVAIAYDVQTRSCIRAIVSIVLFSLSFHLTHRIRYRTNKVVLIQKQQFQLGEVVQFARHVPG